MGTGEIEQERLRVVAYHALWQLFENDPAAEPEDFRTTRLALHRCLDGDGDQLLPSIAGSAVVVPSPGLRLVR